MVDGGNELTLVTGLMAAAYNDLGVFLLASVRRLSCLLRGALLSRLPGSMGWSTGEGLVALAGVR